MPEIVLPDSPKGKEYEDYISALFQAAGYYIEKSISQESILELDIIATDYESQVPECFLIEVKSGGWGFKDIFKVKGWMVYLNINNGYFIVQTSIVESHKVKASDLNINIIEAANKSSISENLCKCIKCDDFDENEVDAWRFSYWVERRIVDRIIHNKKSIKDVKRYIAMHNYYNTVNHDIFFTHNIIDKVEALYSTYQNYPNLSAKVGNELIGNDFDDIHTEIPKSIFNKNYYECTNTDINLSSFIEYRARLALIKSAVDYIVFKENGCTDKVDKKCTLTFLSKSITLDFFEQLPNTFKDGITEISKHEYYKQYPIFWQYFMWLLGGFILNDYYDNEIEFLSIKSKIPIDEIPNALGSFQLLFPTPGGWFNDMAPNSSITIMKNFPVQFFGIGANWRRYMHTKSYNYSDLSLTGTHTKSDLLKWNAVGYDILAKG